MSEYKEELIFVTDKLGDEVAKVKREKLRELLTTETLQTNDLFQQIIGEDCILVRNDDGTAMLLVKENGKWRLAEWVIE